MERKAVSSSHSKKRMTANEAKRGDNQDLAHVAGVAREMHDQELALRDAGLELREHIIELRARERSKRISTLDILKLLSPIASGVILAFVGVALESRVTEAINSHNRSIDQLLKQEELQVSSAAEIQKLVLDLNGEKDPNRMNLTAVTLAGFGRFAIVPLLNLLDSPTHKEAALAGLRALTLTPAANEACQSLAHVIDNKTALFSHQTHLTVIQQLGRLGCSCQLTAVRRYAEFLESKPFVSSVAGSPVPLDVANLRKETQTTIALLASSPIATCG